MFTNNISAYIYVIIFLFIYFFVDRRHRSSSSSDDSDNQLHRAPPPPIISKVSLQFKPSTSSHKLNKPPAIQIKLNAPLKSSAAQIPIIKPNKLVAKAFNDDSDEEVEEMPAECRMRMRNIGKNTITSSGPNSFGKTKQGFVDSKKIFEKQLKSISSDD